MEQSPAWHTFKKFQNKATQTLNTVHILSDPAVSAKPIPLHNNTHATKQSKSGPATMGYNYQKQNSQCLVSASISELHIKH